ncbi:MAG: hypothetical protein DCF25_19465 [Leptolyngbya foveolarum]|uniref:Uncharacterized protein n=1 Tax=Leptolyngbya foveolarum TaxID=47253 RepID=A0A2W4U2A2_9CYAN|nr:MAG: hypothetical protein DCF25_19465 [Leptolyngbya foveolarum]
MNATSDLEVLKSLETLEGLITGGIKKAEDLLQDVWDEETFTQVRSELVQTRAELQQSRSTLIKNQHKSQQERESLESVLAEALAQRTALEQSGSEYKQLYFDISKQAQRGQACLSSLTSSIQNAEQANTQINATLEQVEVVQQKVSAVDQKYQETVQLKTQITEIVERMGDYNSFEALILSLKTATAKLQDEQVAAQTRLQVALEPTDRKINRLIMAQCAPWWWPSNWWWKTKVSFTAKRMATERSSMKQLL